MCNCCRVRFEEKNQNTDWIQYVSGEYNIISDILIGCVLLLKEGVIR